MRTVRLIGVVKHGQTRLARFCAWGNHWMSDLDETLHRHGAPTTHGMCPDCATRWLEPATPPEAA